MQNSSARAREISLAILEDNANMLLGLKAQFDRPGYCICVACDDLDDFLSQVEKFRPQVAIVDLRMWSDHEAGLYAVEQVRQLSPSTRFIIYTQYDSLVNFDKALRLGVQGFVRKEYDIQPKISLVEIVDLVANGRRHYDDEMFEKYVRMRDSIKLIPDRESVREPQQPTQGLTKRQIEVLKLIDQGLSQQEIAERLVMSINTVKAHTKNSREKLGVHTTHDAILTARLLGIM